MRHTSLGQNGPQEGGRRRKGGMGKGRNGGAQGTAEKNKEETVTMMKLEARN